MASDDAIARAVVAFREAAIAKGADGGAPTSLDHSLHTTMAAAVETFRSAGEAGVYALRSLAHDPSPMVRGWAAAELLSRSETAALSVVEDLATGPGLIGFNARVVLQQFRAGCLKSPFPPPAR